MVVLSVLTAEDSFVAHFIVACTQHCAQLYDVENITSATRGLLLHSNITVSSPAQLCVTCYSYGSALL